MFRKALTGKVLHEIHGEVLISNIENEIGSSLVDSLGNVGLGQQVINLVGISGEVLVYQVEWIPLPVIGEVVGLGFPERMENENRLDRSDIMNMSDLTRRILRSINYEHIKIKRKEVNKFASI